MNIVIMRVLFFSAFIVSIFSPMTFTSTQSNHLEKEKKEQKLLASTNNLAAITHTALIQTMQDLENNLAYWITKSKDQNSNVIFTFLAGKTKKQRIQEHITELRTLEKIHATALGTLYTIRKTKDISPVEYSNKVLEICASLVSIPSPLTPKTKQHIFDTVEEKIEQATPLMQNYTKNFRMLIAPHAKPSHLARHWWKYLLGGITLASAGYIGYKNRETLSAQYNKTVNTAKLQWQKRLVTPVKDIMHNISNKMHENLIEENAILDARVDTIKEETVTYLNRQNISEEEKIKILNSFMSGNNTYVMQDLGDQIRNITQNIASDVSSNTYNWFISFLWTPEKEKPNSRLLETFRQLSLSYELKGIKGERELNELKESQKINILIFALAPALLATYGVYKISTAAFNSLFFKKIILVPLQERMLLMRRMLNHFDNGIETKLSYEMQGHLVYWIEKLQQYILQLPQESQENFKEDLQELASIDINIKQKHEVIKRMYDIYTFLQPKQS